MFLTKWIATFLTCVIGLSATIVLALLSLILGTPTSLLFRMFDWSPRYNPFEWVARGWNSFIIMLYRVVMYMKLEHHSAVPRSAVGKYVLYLPNHGSTLEMMIWGWYATKYLNTRMTIVIDSRNDANPIGWALRGIGGLFINRKDPEEAKRTIARELGKILAQYSGPRNIVVCPDMGRPKLASIQRDKQRFPWAVDWIGPVCFPRAGGFERALAALQEACVEFRVVTSTVAIGAGENIGLGGLHKLFGSTVHVAAYDVTDEMPSTPEERRLWLEALWQRKATAINCWRHHEGSMRRSPLEILALDICGALIALIPFFL